MAKFLTTIGINKLLTASPLDPIEIKSLVVGTGTGTPTQDITALFNEVYRSNASDPIKNGAKLGFATVIPLDAGSWSLTEWGWVDSAGDLIAYGQFDNPIYKEAGSMTLEPTLYIELSNSTDSQMFITDVLNFPHNELTGRSEADAHPISSITGLSKAIGLKSNKITTSKVLTVDDYGAFDVDASAGNIVITMPDVSLVASNNYVFTRTDSTTNTVFFQPFGNNKFIAEGVAGANSRLLQYETSWFKKLDANNWVGGRSVQEQLTSISGKPWLVSKGVGVSRFLMETNVVNALNSTDTLNPLSAAQGKALFDMFGGGANYFKIPNPIEPTKPWIVQIFKTATVSANTEQKFIQNFPVVFPNNCFGVLASQNQIDFVSINTLGFLCCTYAITKSSVGVIWDMIVASGSAVSPREVCLIAIGN